jgi:hypothetical protein
MVHINPIEIGKPLVRCGDEYYDLSVEEDIEIIEVL